MDSEKSHFMYFLPVTLAKYDQISFRYSQKFGLEFKKLNVD